MFIISKLLNLNFATTTTNHAIINDKVCSTSAKYFLTCDLNFLQKVLKFKSNLVESCRFSQFNNIEEIKIVHTLKHRQFPFSNFKTNYK